MNEVELGGWICDIKSGNVAIEQREPNGRMGNFLVSPIHFRIFMLPGEQSYVYQNEVLNISCLPPQVMLVL